MGDEFLRRLDRHFRARIATQVHQARGYYHLRRGEWAAVFESLKAALEKVLDTGVNI